MKCNKINDHAFCYVLHLFCWSKGWNWQRLNRHMMHFSFWHSLINVWRYMIKSTTMALRKFECACWKVDNTGFVSHLTEEAWLTVSNLFCESSIFKQCHMTSLKFEIQIFQYFWVRQLAYQQHYVGNGLQNIKMSPLVMGTDKENIRWTNKISGKWNICFWLDHDTKHLETCLYS